MQTFCQHCNWLTFKDSARGTYTWLIHTAWNLTGNLALLLRSSIAEWFKLIMKNCVCLVEWSLTCSLSRTKAVLTAVKSITPATGGCPLLPVAEMLASSKTPKLQSLALPGSRTRLISSLYLVKSKQVYAEQSCVRTRNVHRKCRTLPAQINAFFRILFSIFQLYIILRSKTPFPSAV